MLYIVNMADINFILRGSVHVVYTLQCNKQKLGMGGMGKGRRRDKQREKDEDDTRNWMWVRDNKL